MGNCDPACMKIIINSGFVAPAAALLASRTDGPMRAEAMQLAENATAAVQMYEHAEKYGAITRTGAFKFSGCEHAAKIMGWVRALAEGGDVVARCGHEIIDAPNLMRGRGA